MTKRFFLTAGAFICLSLACKSADGKILLGQQTIQNPRLPATKVYTFTATPIWADEFDTPGLPDPKIWSYDVGGSGWGNNELQYYTEEDKDNVHIENGLLTIEARKENFGGKNYTSARMVTKGKKDFLYGKVEVRAKVPVGRGNWPAIWTLASQSDYGRQYWPDNGEIDVMEHVGFNPAVMHFSVHTKAFNHVIGTQKTSKTQVNDFDTAFHVYSIEWTPKTIQAFIDGKPYFYFENSGKGWEEWPFDKKQHLLLNLAVGGNWGGQKGVDDSIFPNKFVIDYVRVYGLNP
jgi:beta-glucanase (GH16 family)